MEESSSPRRYSNAIRLSRRTPESIPCALYWHISWFQQGNPETLRERRCSWTPASVVPLVSLSSLQLFNPFKTRQRARDHCESGAVCLTRDRDPIDSSGSSITCEVRPSETDTACGRDQVSPVCGRRRTSQGSLLVNSMRSIQLLGNWETRGDVYSSHICQSYRW